MTIVGKPTKVAVCLPCGDTLMSRFAYDLFRMGCYTTSKTAIKMGVFQSCGSMIPQQRNQLVNAMLKDPSFTHVLFLDTDMRFPPDTLERLISHNVPAVCASYTERKPPYRSVAFPSIANFNERVYSPPSATGLEKIEACGFGCVLLTREACEAIPQPRFMVGWSPAGESHIGEDIYFFMQLNQKGFPLYLDHDLTHEVSHIGIREFTAEDACESLVLLHETEANAAKFEEANSGSIQLVQ